MFVMSTGKQTNISISVRLQELVDEVAAGNAKKFSENAGIGSVTFYNYLKGRLPSAELLTNICESYKVNVNWLLTGKGRKYISDLPGEFAKESFSYLPLVETQLSAGNGSFVVSEEVKEYCAFRTEWLFNSLGSPKGKYLLSVAGDSMFPTIQNGDTVMLDTTATHIFDGNIYALRLDDTIMIKRMALRPGEKVLVISDNREEYEPYEAARKDIHVLGRIVWFARTLVKSD